MAKTKKSLPIYLGKNSIICKKEKKCIKDHKGKGITTCSEAKAIITMVLRDLKRGWTYDHYGKKIKMTKQLAIKRIAFLKKLAIFHKAKPKERNCINKVVDQTLKRLTKI